MEAAYKNARAYRDEISSNINKLKTEIERLYAEANRVDRFLKEYEDFASEAGHTENIVSPDPNAPVEKSKRESLGNPPKEEIAKHARELIEVLEAPVSRNALFAELESSGLVIRGTDPKMVLSTTMWRLSKTGGEFVRLPKHGYWLRDRDYEPAGYKAHSMDKEEQLSERREAMFDHPTSIAAREASITKEDEEVQTKLSPNTPSTPG